MKSLPQLLINELLPGDQVILETIALEDFLISVERRAFLMARSAVGNREDALDIVQDAMSELVVRYRYRDHDQWRPLFYRILNNKIHDTFRRRKIQSRFLGLLSRDSPGHGDRDDDDILARVPGPDSDNPARRFEQDLGMAVLQDALSSLPRRQREVFMLRCWEGLSTAETARTMKCSEGSVKTHYSRALTSLKSQLEGFSP